jgi:ABC-type Zn uptake system ZnuABC Zn-binding protein ZnuA
MEAGGDRVEVESLIQGNQDPHFAQPKPSYLLKLRQADLLIVVGLQLEGAWLTEGHHRPSLMSQSGNPRIQPGAAGFFDGSQYVQVLEIPNPPVTPTIHAAGNPYYWLDPENGRTIARGLANKLSELRPNDAAYFEERFRAFSQRLSDAEKVWDAEIQPYRASKVVTYHRSWAYFLRHFQLVSVGEIESQPGLPPSRSHTREIISIMRRQDAPVIMVEPYFELKTAKAIAHETGTTVVVIPSSVGGAKGVGTYFRLFDYDLGFLTKAFAARKTSDRERQQKSNDGTRAYVISD